MPSTIVFDTNFLRSFSTAEFRAGTVPGDLATLIQRADARGDLIAIPQTVRLEINAWLAVVAAKERTRIANARQVLEQSGFEVTPAAPDPPPDVDVLQVLSKAFPKVALLQPTLEDYNEAERRTSYRLPPFPKAADAEEMRDRVIWSQLVRLASKSGSPILIVSGDTLFRNGAASEEGVSAKIENVQDAAELSQRLNARPPHIRALISELMKFAPALNAQGINLREEGIQLIEDLRKINLAGGVQLQMFILRTSGLEGLGPSEEVVLAVTGDIPTGLVLLRPQEKTVVINLDMPNDQRNDMRDKVLRANAGDEAVLRRIQELLRG